MSKKEEINKEDLEFLKQLLGETKEEEKESPDNREFKNLKKKISESSIKDGLIQFDKEYKILYDKKIGNSELKNLNLKDSHNLPNIENQKKITKKRKIKKKELFLEIAEALPIIKENNKLLHELIQQFKLLNKAITQKPIKIKILK